MNIVQVIRIFAVAVVLVVLTATGLWAAGAEEEPAAAAEKEMVRDPTTGEMVPAPEYGGTFTWVSRYQTGQNTDSYPTPTGGLAAVGGVVERLSIADWGIDRDVHHHISLAVPLWVMKGQLAESWETPDDTTIIFYIRKGVHWHDTEPMNGRELTAKDVEYNWHRYFGLGKWSEFGPVQKYESLPIESVTATDDWTVVFELTKPYLGVLSVIFNNYDPYIYPPEIIEEHGDANDWRNVIGTGPYMITDVVEATSVSWTKNPDYWGYDEKFPENRLPYFDEIRLLMMEDEATRISAMRTGKIDYMGFSGGSEIRPDQVDGLQKTNPELKFHPYQFRSDWTSFAMNVRQPPFDDIRVRKAMQMAQDLETVNNAYYKGRAKWIPQGVIGDGAVDHFVPFDEWPEEVKSGYRYDPEGAEKLLDEAGYARGADGIRFKTTQTQFGAALGDTSLSEIAADYWAAIGVDVEVTIAPDTSAHWQAMTRDHSYEGMSSAMLGFDHGDAMWMMRAFGHSEGTINIPGVQDAHLDSLIEAAAAATTLEEQQRQLKEADAYTIKNHYYVWYFKVPMFNVNQPWLVGYNGEFQLGWGQRYGQLWARVWIDSEMKEAMGY